MVVVVVEVMVVVIVVVIRLRPTTCAISGIRIEKCVRAVNNIES